MRYAGASGDHNPMHHDEVQATAAGQPTGRHLVDLDVRLFNEAGEEKVVGEVTAALPSRS